MYYHVNKVLEEWTELNFTAARNERNAIEAYVCDNYAEFVNMLEPLSMLAFVRDGISVLRDVSFSAYTGGQAVLSQTKHNEVVRVAARIKESLIAVQNAFDTLGIELRTSGFDIKLPPDVTLGELGKCAKDLNLIFTQCPILQCEGDSIQFSGVDIGSKWLVFAAAGAFILERLAVLVDKAMVIRSHWLTCKKQEEEVRRMKAGNDFLEKTISVHKGFMEIMKEQAVKELSEAYQVNDPEEQERIGFALDCLEKWMNKGMEIYAAIGSPDEVKAVFPPIGKQQLLESDLKYLMASEKEAGGQE